MKKKKIKLRLEDIDIDSMEILNTEILSTFMGGGSNRSWNCVLNCFDYLDHGNMNGYSSYYGGGSYYSHIDGEDPYNPSQVGGFYNSDISMLGFQGGLNVNELVGSFNMTGSGHTLNGQSIMLVMPGTNGNPGHAVVLTGATQSTLTYYDPTTNQFNAKSL